MDALKKLPIPWIAIALLVLVLIFMVRRSGYTPTTGAVITLMDLEEFSEFSPEQKANYVNKLMAHKPMLSAAASTNSIMEYKMHLDQVMTMAMRTPRPPRPPQPKPIPMPPPPSKCVPGTYSATGFELCTRCPINTYCPMEGTITPMKCPMGTTSPLGSMRVESCVQMVSTM